MADTSATTPRTHPAAPIWPPARVRVTTPRLEMYLPTDAELVELTGAALAGVHAPEEMPFAQPWSDEPSPTLERAAFQWHMHARASWNARSSWNMLFVVVVDGEVAGAQDVAAREFPIRREVDSGSWLGRRFQGRGLGTEMREAMLHFAFEGLGALAANSGAYDDNAASIRVSEKAGYAVSGHGFVTRRRGPNAPDGPSAERAGETRYRIEREAWLERRRDDIELHGLDEAVLDAFGATPAR